MPPRPKRDHSGRRLPTARADGVVGDGLLLRDGEQIDRPLFSNQLLPEVESRIRNYRPRKSPWFELWPLIQEFVVRIVLSICPPTSESARYSMIAVTRFSGWATQQGLELDEEVLFQPIRVEQFIAVAPFCDAERRNVRSRLRAIGRKVTRKAPWPPEPTRLSRVALQPPYSTTDIELLWHDIGRQYKTIKRAAEVVHHLGLGAGLRPMTIRATTADQIVQVCGYWCVAAQRKDVVHHIPILAPHVPAVLDLADRYPVGPLVHEWAHRKTISAMLQDFKKGYSTPRPVVWRYRSTWLLSHLAMGTRLDLLRDAAGVREQRGLMELLKYLPPVGQADSIRLLGGGDA